MRLRDVPVTQRRGFILVEAKPRAERHFGQQLLKAQVGRRVIGGIAAEDQEHRDVAGANVGCQFPHGGPLLGRRFLDGLGEIHGLIEISKGLIDGVNERVNDGRLLIAGNDERSAGMLLAGRAPARESIRSGACGAVAGAATVLMPSSRASARAKPSMSEARMRKR